VTERVVNFSAGPGVLPVTVLEQAQAELVSLPGVGASPLEVSHRGAWFTAVIEEAEANLRSLLAIPEHHRVLFLQGGASLQFSMVASNLLRGSERRADYVVTGSWSEKALKEAQRQGDVRVAWTGADAGFRATPTDDELRAALDPASAYVHITTNETIQGVEFPDTPTVPEDAVLVADCSSDFLSRPMDVAGYGVVYAGAQKNAGPAGLTLAIVRDDVLARVTEGLPTMLYYRTYANHSSLYNTPPVFAIYVFLLVTRWLRDDIGGLAAMHERNVAKAALLYDVIDEHPEFYRGHAETASRSLMNVTFRLPTGDLETTFVREAAEQDLVELEGHRSVGGIRASIYNAMPVEGVAQLAAAMHAFAQAHA
jgi:phosphoserine aminotransferase